jgi:hypothetical protein
MPAGVYMPWPYWDDKGRKRCSLTKKTLNVRMFLLF